MEVGICILSIVAVRERPDHRVEMVSQLLFGELIQILEQRNGWYHIRMIYDNYQGWIPINQAEKIEFDEYTALRKQEAMVTGDLISFVHDKKQETSFPVSAGCSIYTAEDGIISFGRHAFSYTGQILKASSPCCDLLPDHAMLFLNTPYLWGGRSAFGLDCSGFVQLVFKMAGIRIPRDAAIQATGGETIHLINEAKPGDLLFFDDQEGQISHVGMLLQEGFIIHAHGKVRIDRVDHNGIFDSGTNKYTHKLRLIKRMHAE